MRAITLPPAIVNPIRMEAITKMKPKITAIAIPLIRTRSTRCLTGLSKRAEMTCVPDLPAGQAGEDLRSEGDDCSYFSAAQSRGFR
jgi:hypothetical protein